MGTWAKRAADRAASLGNETTRDPRGRRRQRLAPAALLGAALVLCACLAGGPAWAKYASYVIDAKTGEVLHSVNADTRNYPASLTKMMTMYKMFQAVESGRWTMNTRLRMSRRAARQPASKLGLPAGDTISVRDAILALSVKSANDIATAVAENHSGGERAFAKKMTKTARALGMSRTTFRNASGLPHSRQLSTARDMSKLARALLRDFPQHYHFFSRARFTFRGKTYKTHNKLLLNYAGADGFKTGYIRASGFNLVTSAKRQGRRVIGVIFGANSSRHRNRLMARFMDKGFGRIGVGQEVRTATAPRPAASRPTVRKTGSQQQVASLGRWGIQVGAFARKGQARNMAEKAVDILPALLDGTLTRVVPLKKRNGRVLHRARVYGLSKREAYRACALLEKRRVPCMELRAPKTVEISEAQHTTARGG